MRSFPMRVARFLPVAALLLGTACNDGVGPIPGTFTATVTGDLSLSLSGVAVFGTTSSGGIDGLLIQMIRGDPQASDFDVVGIARFGTERPAVGTHRIVSAFCNDCTTADFDAVFAMHRTDGSFAQFRSESGGTMTIEESSADRLVGSFTFYGIAFSTSDGIEADSVTVSGSFTAVAGDVSAIG
jgi:hypothetical protein